MPIVSANKSSNPIDRNAVSLDRHRRNWQRLTQGALNGILKITLAMMNWATGKGQLLVAESSTSYVALPAGTDGYVLTADSSATAGVEWAPAGGGVTIYTNSGNVTSGGTIVVTHAADSTNERLCYAAASVVTSVTQVPSMTSDTAPSGVVSSSGIQSPNYDWLAFNLPTANGKAWGSQYGFPAWLQYQFPSTTTIYGYAITGGTTATDNQDPTTWVFAGSPDGSTWTTLDSQTGITWGTGPERHVYPLGSPATYQYYRITITANDGNADDAGAMNTFELLGAPTTVTGPVIVGNTLLDSSDTDRVTAEFTSTTTTTFTNQYAETLPLVVNVII